MSKLRTIEPRGLALARPSHLTPMQQRVAQLVALGWSNGAIRETLGWTANSVGAHIKRLLDHFRVPNRHELILLLNTHPELMGSSRSHDISIPLHRVNLASGGIDNSTLRHLDWEGRVRADAEARQAVSAWIDKLCANLKARAMAAINARFRVYSKANRKRGRPRKGEKFLQEPPDCLKKQVKYMQNQSLTAKKAETLVEKKSAG